MQLAWRMLKRNWRSGELKLLALSVTLAVAVLGAISIFTSRMENTLHHETNTVLGGDLIVEGPSPIKDEWKAKGNELSLEQADAMGLMTMVYAGDNGQLVSVKAVGKNYPLRGEFEISDEAASINVRKVAQGPKRGETWLDTRLLTVLNLKLGDSVQIGDVSLRVAAVVVQEPDALSPSNALGSRLIMSIDDIAATGLIVPGSMITYQWILASENAESIKTAKSFLGPIIKPHFWIRSLEGTQENISRTQNTAARFLLLTAVIAVLLAGVAISIAARQFADRHVNQVALIKSLGISSKRLRFLYAAQLIMLAALASMLGLLLGYLFHFGIVWSVQGLFKTELSAPLITPFILSFLSGILCLVCFALPSLWHLTRVPPLKILRRELTTKTTYLWIRAVIAGLAVISLIFLFARDIFLALSVTLALLILTLVGFLIAWLLLVGIRKVLSKTGGALRLALNNIKQHFDQSLTQLLVFGVASMLLVTMMILRSSLIADWQLQLPQNAPNMFLTNIPEEDSTELASELNALLGEQPRFVPNVRARLTALNKQPPSEEMRKTNPTFQRELNITMLETMPSWNSLVEGSWWSADNKLEEGVVLVSVEQETAKRSNIKLGDRVSFSVGGLPLEAKVASIRKVDWRSMQLNYLFVFEPNTLTAFSPNYMSAVYVPVDKRADLYRVLQRYPRLMPIEVSRILETVKKVIAQLTNALSFTLVLTLFGGALVLWAAVMNTQAARMQESGLLRAMGAARQLIQRAVIIEFGLLGFFAGVIAVVGAESLLLSLQHFAFKMPIKPHYLFWFLTPLCTAVFVALLGYRGTKAIISTPPMVVLREAAA